MYCVSAFFFIFTEISRMKSEILSDKEIRILSQQIQLPEVGMAGQEKIKNARVLVIGAGGKGTSVLQSLVAAGTGTIGITDNMLVEENILPRQDPFPPQSSYRRLKHKASIPCSRPYTNPGRKDFD